MNRNLTLEEASKLKVKPQCLRWDPKKVLLWIAFGLGCITPILQVYKSTHAPRSLNPSTKQHTHTWTQRWQPYDWKKQQSFTIPTTLQRHNSIPTNNRQFRLLSTFPACPLSPFPFPLSRLPFRVSLAIVLHPSHRFVIGIECAAAIHKTPTVINTVLTITKPYNHFKTMWRMENTNIMIS